MNQPETKPNNPCFSSGPTAKRPDWALSNLSIDALGRSHRASVPKARIKAVIDQSKALLGMPDDYVLGIVKSYTTRVGAGPFPTELFDETGEYLQRVGKEFGAVTGRRRRCGWFDAVALRRSVIHSSISGLCMTKLDVLDGLDAIRLCVGYRAAGEVSDVPPLLVEGFGEASCSFV